MGWKAIAHGILEMLQTWLQEKIDNVGGKKACLIAAVDQSHTFIAVRCAE